MTSEHFRAQIVAWWDDGRGVNAVDRSFLDDCLSAADALDQAQSKLEAYEKADRERYSHSLRLADAVNAELQSRLDATLKLAWDATYRFSNLGYEKIAAEYQEQLKPLAGVVERQEKNS